MSSSVAHHCNQVQLEEGRRAGTRELSLPLGVSEPQVLLSLVEEAAPAASVLGVSGTNS